MEIKLKSKSSHEWLQICLHSINDFLIDHAACERKASATGIQFVVRYPDRSEIAQPMIKFAQEELSHFRDIMKILFERGLTISKDEKNPYINSMLKLIRSGRDVEFLDRLLCFGIIEARGCERFSQIGESIDDPALKFFYSRLARAEAKHHRLFLKMAQKYFSKSSIETRLEELLNEEALILEALPIRPAVH